MNIFSKASLGLLNWQRIVSKANSIRLGFLQVFTSNGDRNRAIEWCRFTMAVCGHIGASFRIAVKRERITIIITKV